MSRLTWARHPWDSYWQAEEDESRHRALVRRALEENLTDLLTEESIMLSDGRRTVRVPITSLKEPRFRFRTEPPGQAGEGSGDGAGGGSPAAGGGHAGGRQPGLESYLEARVTLDEADDLLFKDLELPAWDPRRKAPVEVGGEALSDLAHSGVSARLARRDTLRAAICRSGPGGPILLDHDSLRYRAYAPGNDGEVGAVLLAMMDTSGSMGTFEKHMARSFFYWVLRFLRRYHPTVDAVFLAHDVRAREVQEDTFFHRGASGGTVSSSVYRLARGILDARYPRSRYNAYAFHFTDGGNLTSDNPEALARGAALAERTNLFGYGEIHDTMRNPSPLYQGFLQQQGTRAVVVRRKEDVMTALRAFFARTVDGGS